MLMPSAIWIYSNDSDYLEGRLYVGGLNHSATKDDVERAFSKYGKIIDLWLARNPPGFAFVEFSSQHDADECLRALDGSDFMGNQIKVELSRAMPGGRGRGRGRGGRGGRGGDEVLEEGTETEVIPHQTPIPTMRIAVDRPCDEGITIDES
ncbi:putative RNA-binding protein Rsf1 isoform X2 [Apostichopus japonicus]|uniref:Putative RNA-binding protein Rsf1 isoform X2 n=1 Tax=Stichopus japonicus TaxID=307972 RepID=A0A2G8LR44_STIJA|nr:putative RNA-binding protein Rsf1 isoform X2 [Apostichopus japonicus]